MSNETKIVKDPSGKKLVVTRSFDAPLEKVWQAWTESALLEKWWAPRPFRAETKIMDFSAGGQWLYAMAGPEGEKHWCKVEFKTIDAPNSFTASNGFCDEDGNMNPDFPVMQWENRFKSNGSKTDVIVELTFESEEELEKIVAMGFKEGFTMALGNLDELFA